LEGSSGKRAGYGALLSNICPAILICVWTMLIDIKNPSGIRETGLQPALKEGLHKFPNSPVILNHTATRCFIGMGSTHCSQSAVNRFSAEAG
jgi:hypothetical protein